MRFLRSKRGNVAMLAALFFLPFLGLIGLAIDFSNQRKAHAQLQDALDAGLLSAARSGLPDGPARDAHVLAYLTANLEGSIDPGTLSVTVDDGAVEGEVVGSATGSVPLFFGVLFGQANGPLVAASQVSAAAGELEVVLALDTTGSMTGSKIAALKTAAESMVVTLMADPSVRIGIVPFAQYVNVGTGNRNEPGLAIPPDGRSCWMETVREQTNPHNCRTAPRTCRRQVCRDVPATCYNDGTPYACTRRQCENTGAEYDCSQQVCDYDYVNVQRERCSTQTWRGCVGSREPPLNTRDDNQAVGVPGLMNVNCSNPLLRLSDRQADVLARIRTLSVSGETYIPSGLSMGWAVLSNRYPFADGSPASPGGGVVLNRALVLMTDGANTLSKSGGSPRHDGRNAGDANTVMTQLCDNIKADGVQIATVAFAVTDTTIRNRLTACASSAAMAYEPETAAELTAAFDAIAGQLQQLRVAR